MTTGRDDKRRSADPDDLPPTGDEARAQRDATMTPVLWMVVGVVLIVVFVLLVAQGGDLFTKKASGPWPVRSAPAARGA